MGRLMLTAADLLLSDDEVRRLSGGLIQPAAQLRELHARGFERATRSKVTGRVVLTRAHFDAVEARRATMEPEPPQPAPKLRPPRLRAA
jgi:hypothetical protein